MRIQNIQSGYDNQNFKAKLVDTYAMRKIKAGLTSREADTFEKYVNIIEKVKDDKTYVYDALLAGNNRVYKIHEIDKNGNLINPALFADYGKNPLNPLKQLARRYENYLKR